MSEPIDNKQFMEWVEQYANDTISPEAAEQLLNAVQSDPDKLDQLCSQLQTDQLLEIMQKQDPMHSIAGAVLERAKRLNCSADLKKVRRAGIFFKVAASVAVLLGLGALMLPQKKGLPGRSKETASQHVEIEAKFVDYNQEALDDLGFVFPSSDKQSVAESEPRLKMKLMKPSAPIVSPDPAPAPVVAEKLVPLEVALPKPVFAGTPKKIKSDNLEIAPQFADQRAGAYFARTAAPSRESYAAIVENEFKHAKDKALSTFSIDVDTASYANVRRYLTAGRLPPKDAVRIEEMVNYFDYVYQGPKGTRPFATSMALTDCPWNEDHQLLRIGLQGRKLADEDRRDSNLVFLLDVSGSMNSADKLPLLKAGFEKMVRALGEKDRVAIVVYAGSSGVVLDSTSAMEKETIIGALNRLKAGGSTAGGQGIELAYRLASDHFIKDGINRVILATDGDFNVGVSNIDALQRLIEEKRKSNVFLSVLGFGTGNLQDAKMEMLANKGNGNYFYIDSEREAEKVLVKQLTANMVTIAKDVKIQIEFNPALIRSYRLIGYENRMLAARDFADDTKDAGEIGAGHQVTALYELVPAGAPATEDGVPLKYTQPEESAEFDGNRTELLTLKLRYKEPEGSKSKLLTFGLDESAYRPDSMDASFRWATAVAAFGMHLRDSNRIGEFTMEDVVDLAQSASERDPSGYRAECLKLMHKAMQLKTGEASTYPQWQYRD